MGTSRTVQMQDDLSSQAFPHGPHLSGCRGWNTVIGSSPGETLSPAVFRTACF
ncbi:hypothetical protein ACRRTK_022292 [Alexandromys fortis]